MTSDEIVEKFVTAEMSREDFLQALLGIGQSLGDAEYLLDSLADVDVMNFKGPLPEMEL
jgi:hypothetical protein